MEGMEIKIITSPIQIAEVAALAKQQFGDLIKATVDINQHLIALGGDLHADEEQLLLEQGSLQQNLWGINLYPAEFGSDKFIEYDSMINLRPSQGNRSRGVEDPNTRAEIKKVVETIIVKELKRAT